MLDDFLIVSPRKTADTDDVTLERGRSEGALFDSLLKELNLPLAIEKSQPAAFSTVWCGVEYFSKTGKFGVPKKKWKKLRAFFETNMLDMEGVVTGKVEAGVLQTLLGKFSHIMIIWRAGRPCLLYLRKLMMTASFRSRQRGKLSDIHQEMIFDPDCLAALDRWCTIIQADSPPMRRMLP